MNSPLMQLRSVIDPFCRAKSRQYGEAVEAILMHHGIQCALFGAMVAQGMHPQQAEMYLKQEAEMGRWGGPGYAMMGRPTAGMMGPAMGTMMGPMRDGGMDGMDD